MAETIVLATPITKPSRTTIKLEKLIIDVASKYVYVEWVGDDGVKDSVTYPTPAPEGSAQPSGQQLITALNTANLTTNSLVKRVLNRLQTDGYIPAGNVTGAPE